MNAAIRNSKGEPFIPQSVTPAEASPASQGTLTRVNVYRLTRPLLVALVAFACPFTAYAQHEQHQPAPASGWGWSLESNAFLTANFQERKFRDFHQVESQNWLMALGSRRVGTSTLTLHSMLSFEPFTL